MASPRDTDDLVRYTARLSLHAEDKWIMLKCGPDHKIHKKSLAAQSPWFAIAVQVPRAIQSGYIEFPAENRQLIATLIQFLQTREYRGPYKKGGGTRAVPAWERNTNLPAGQGNGMTIEFRSKDPQVLRYFSEFRHSWILHGDAALKACKLITCHELFSEQNERGFEEVVPGRANEYRCQPELLPLPIQYPLYEYLLQVRSRKPGISSDNVFHAAMYHCAVKYMLPALKHQVVCAFRDGVKPWINLSLFQESSFLSAVELIVQPMGVVQEDEHWELAHILVRIIGAHWGWMRHDVDVVRLLNRSRHAVLRRNVMFEVERLEKEWEEKGWVAFDGSSAWGDRE